MDRPFAFYGGRDPREIPTYTVAEAAAYVRIPATTLRSWVKGRHYFAQGERRFFAPIIHLTDRRPPLLSFMNLVEAHVLSAIRREHEIPLDRVRQAMKFLNEAFPSPHPLADQQFETDGVDLFIEQYGRLINVSRQGQLAIREWMQASLRRIERDGQGLAVRLYPFTQTSQTDEPRRVMIDPFVSFGRRVIVGTGIPTAVIAERYTSGESIDELAYDYDRDRLDIEAAIRSELRAA